MGWVIKQGIFSFAASTLAFLVLVTFFYFKAYYPYRIYFESDSNALPFVNISLLDQKIKYPYSDGVGGTYYIDSVEKREKGKLLFRGRYYGLTPISAEQSQKFLTDAMGGEVSAYLSESVCSSGVELNENDVYEQLKVVNKKTLVCLQLLGDQLKRDFRISSFTMTEDGRMKKIIFVCLVISILFGSAIYVLLEGRNIFKNEQ